MQKKSSLSQNNCIHRLVQNLMNLSSIGGRMLEDIFKEKGIF